MPRGAHSVPLTAMPPGDPDAAAPVRHGPLVLIGGGATPGGAALDAFVAPARAREGGRVVVLTSASSNPDAAARVWRRDLLAAGCRNLELPPARTRREADAARLTRAIEAADGIFLTGGDQVKLVSILSGTAAAEALWSAHQRGAVVGGTSAGAAALGDTTLAGNETDDTGQLVEQYIGPGLGFVGHGTVIDTHFSERRRLYRLFMALAEFPSLMGIGVDEDTALVVRGDMGEVVGRGGITFVDGRGVRYSSAGERRGGRARPLTLSAVRVGLVGAGDRFDLARREVVAVPNSPESD